MLDGLSFDPFTLLDDAYGPAEVGVCTDLRLGPSSRPLPYRLPPSRPGRTRRQHPQPRHQALGLVEEDRHLVALGLNLQRLPTVPILRVIRASLDRRSLTATVVSAHI